MMGSAGGGPQFPTRAIGGQSDVEELAEFPCNSLPFSPALYTRRTESIRYSGPD